MQPKPDVIFDAERMKYPHTGIYHYCRQLGNALLQQQGSHSHRLGFYLPNNAAGVFGNDCYKILQQSFHRFYKPFAKDYKVWHVTNQLTNYYPWRSAKKIVLTVHDLNFLYEKKSKDKQQQYLSGLQKKVSGADTVIAISAFVKKEIEKNLLVEDGKLKVIHNGCNIPENIKAERPGFPVSFPYIFTIGAINPKKNFHILPAAIVNSDLHLVIAGVVQNKAYLYKILEEAKRLGVAHRVHYVGAVPENVKYWLLQNCALFTFPSLAEGFGLPVIEAMRFGKPVLLSKATSLPEIGGEVAYYLDNFEPAHIEQMTGNVLNTYTAAHALDTIKWSYQFDWKIAAQKYWEVYEALAK